MRAEFNIIGFHKDIYLNGKFYGSIKMNEADRETMGYMGRRVEVLDQDFKNKNKKIKAGTEVVSECVPLCGRIKGNREQVIQTLANSRAFYNSK